MIQAIIFSMDRACQLKLLLDSLERNAKGIFNVKITYNYSNNKFFKGYQKLKSDGIVDTLHCQKPHIGRQSMKTFILNLIDKNTEFTAFFCDDSILYKKIRERDIVDAMTDDVIAFSLRMGLNTTYSYTQRKTSQLKRYTPYDKHIKWNWKKSKSDFGYPLTIDGHIYHTDVLVPILEKIIFVTPPKLEGAIQRRKPYIKKDYLTAYKKSRLVSVPVNMTQTDYEENRVGEIFPISQGDLNEAFLKGKEIDFDEIDFKNIKGSHQELKLPLK